MSKTNIPEPDLFARTSDPDTSHAAAKAYSGKRMSSAVTAIIRMHRNHGGLADYQQQYYWPWYYAIACSAHLYRQARRIACDRGLLRDSGARVTLAVTKRKQIVWEACDVPPPVLRRCEKCGHLLGRE